MAWGAAVIPGILLVAEVAELAVGLLVLERGQGRLAARFLGAFMLLHAMAFGALSVWILLTAFSGPRFTDSAVILTLILLTFLPALLIAFALTYPTPHEAVRQRTWLLGLPFLVPAAVVATAVAQPHLTGQSAGDTNAPILAFVFLGYLILGAVGATVLFLARARVARTELERERLRFMVKAIAIPVAATAAVAVPAIALFEVGGPVDPFSFTQIILALVAILPAFGLAYGVLRYQVIDLDLKLKRGIKGSTLAAVFLAVFFVVSEAAQVLFAGFAGNELLGVVAAGALVFFLSPLQRLAERVSDTALPGVEDDERYRAQRQAEVYRAAVEEMLADGQMSAKDRRVLLSLQESLGLDGNAASRLEREVLDQLGGGTA